MNHCAWGLGWKRRTCGAKPTTTRVGWPMCEQHGHDWDEWEKAYENVAEAKQEVK